MVSGRTETGSVTSRPNGTAYRTAALAANGSDPAITHVLRGRVRVIPRARSVVRRVRHGIQSVTTSASTRCGSALGCIS